MKLAAVLNTTVFSFISILLPAASIAAEVHLVAEKVENIVLDHDCKIVRTTEPKGDLTYKVMKFAGLQTVTRPIYSDLCESHTQQFITKIFSYSGETDQTPVIGFTGGNEDGEELSFPVFSGFVLSGK
jgi:hypothetical protein